MIEVQIRRPCSENTPLRKIPGTPAIACDECNSADYPHKFHHNPVTEWVPFAEAEMLAHIQEAQSAAKEPK